MGLDMYLYRVSRPEADRRKIYSHEDAEKNHWCYYDDEEIAKLPTAVLNNCVELKIKNEYYNMTKILEDHALDVEYDIEPCGFTSESTFFSITNKDGKIKEIEVKNVDMPSYIYTVINKRNVCVMDEVAYQRKGLNDEGWQLLPENCEYCDEKPRIEKLCEVGGLSEEFLEEWVDNETVFYAWW